MRRSRQNRAFSTLIVASLLLVTLVTAAQASTIRIVSGGRQLPAAYAPLYTSAGLMVPVSLVEWFGGTVERTGGAYVVRRGGQAVEFVAGVAAARIGRSERELVAAPVELEGHLYVPLRFLGDFLGLRISWDVQANTLDLSEWAPSLARNRGSVIESLEPVLPAGSAPAGADGPGGSVTASLVVPWSPAPVVPSAPAVPTAPVISPAPALPQGSAVAPAGERPPEAVSPASRVSEAIARLLERLEALAQVDTDWKELERSTGVRLSPVEAGGVWEYRLRGIPAARIVTATLVDPPRIIVDLEGVPGRPLEPFVSPDPLVQRVRAAEVDGQMRLIFDLAQSVGHRVEEDGDGAKLVLYRPLAVSGVEVSATGGRIALDVPGETAYKMTRLEAPERLVLDLYDATLVTAATVHGPFEGPVTQVRVAQFQPNIARVVLDVAAETQVDVLAGDSGLSLVWGDRLGSVAYRVVSPREVHVGVMVPPGATVRVLRLTHPDRLVMDIDGLKLDGARREELFVEGPVSRLRASQFDATTTRVVADLRRHVRWALVEEQGRTVLVLQEPLLAGRTLTVDAGHGGIDGGAVGVRRGILEKDVNLDIALRLGALLIEAEATVHLTRADDTFVDLWARADLANETRSDVLVSIHANSAPESSAAKGTETYVRMGEPDSERLGEALQRSLTSALSTLDRGVRPNRYLVVRRAEMPAALVEIAFLADPEEEELLGEAWFRQRAAEGIYNGLLRYFYPDDTIEGGDDLVSGEDAPWSVLGEEDAVPLGNAAAS